MHTIKSEMQDLRDIRNHNVHDLKDNNYVSWKPIHDFLYDSLSLTIYELLANKTKYKKFDLENEGQAE